jgi:hypothetical protein
MCVIKNERANAKKNKFILKEGQSGFDLAVQVQDPTGFGSTTEI